MEEESEPVRIKASAPDWLVEPSGEHTRQDTTDRFGWLWALLFILFAIACCVGLWWLWRVISG